MIKEISNKTSGQSAVYIPYQDSLAQFTLNTLSLLFPVWAIIFPIWFCLLLLLLFKIPGALPAGTASALLLFFLTVPILSLITTALCEDSQIVISKDGLTFPLIFLPSLKFKREFAWKDLSTINLQWQGNTKFLAKDTLDLFFSNGGLVRIPLNKISKTDLEELVLGLSLWAGNRGDEQHLKLLQTSLRDDATEQKRPSIFDLWEQELADKFNEISFRPLPIDSCLQNNRFKIIRQLGFGGFSATYLAQFNQRELVVLKESVNHSRTNDSEQAARALLQGEASLLAQINHPQIVRLIDHFVENERQYLVMEYIAGPSLRQLVRENGPQSEAQIIQWAIAICDILHHLHTQSPPILHLDITPENLLLSRNGQIKLIDFGSALEYTGNKTEVLMGKQNYMSPEQIDLSPTPQSDIFALGACICYMFTGLDPNPNMTVSMRSHNSQISQELDQLIGKCTAPDMSERIESVQVLKENLLKIIST